jgi:DNA repair protein RadC
MPFQMLTVSESLETIPASLHITGSFTLHNHPTGDPTPSREDLSITKCLCEAGEIIGCKILDHIICGDQTFTSFVSQGLM